MHKRGINKISKKMTGILLACLLMAGSVMPVYASGITNLRDDTSLTQKCDSVFSVEMVYVDSQQEAQDVNAGNRFLTGDGEEASYVITSRETICVEEELYEQVLQEYSPEPEEEITFVPRLVIKSDVVMDAEVVVSSEEMGFAVLKLSQPVHGREALCFSPEPHRVKAMDSVYSLWSGEQVTEGQVFKRLEEAEISLLWHTAILSGQGSGSPLLDEQGNVIGINTKLLETGYMQAVDIEEVIAVLDVFGVPYTIAEAVEIAPIPEQTEASVTPPGTEKLLQETITEQEGMAEQEDMIQQAAEPEDGNESLPAAFWVGIGVVALMMIGIMILVCRIIAGDRKREKELSGQKREEESATPSMSYQKIPAFSEDTTILGMNAHGDSYPMDVEATTILSSRMGMGECKGFLIREKSGERIYLSRSLFVIGSDGLRVDYCVKDNKSISRVHAQIRQLNGAYTLEDLHATNGTYLNGVKLQDSEVKPLNPGDSIRLANEEFMFYL